MNHAMPQRILFILSFLISATSASPSGSAFAVQPLATPIGGRPFLANLKAVTTEGTITWQGRSGEQTLAAQELVEWGAPEERRRGPQVLTAGGSVLVCRDITIADDVLDAKSDFAGNIRLPLESVRGVIFRPAMHRLRRDRLEHRIVASDGDADRLILSNGDELEGTVLEATPTRVSFSHNVAETNIETQRLLAILFNPSLIEPADPKKTQMRVGLQDGSLLHVSSLVVSNKTADLMLSTGLALSSTESQQIAYLQPVKNRLTYLSDLKVQEYVHTPYLDRSWSFHTDRNALRGRLRAGGRLFEKGLGMHSASRLTYSIEGKYQRFAAELALDQHAGQRGSVTYRVMLQLRDAWREAYRSPIVRGGMHPIPVDIDIKGARAIRLAVDFAERGDELDHANWLNARLVRE